MLQLGVYVAQVHRVPFVDERPWHTKSAYIGDVVQHERRADVWAVDDSGFHSDSGPRDLLLDLAPNATAGVVDGAVRFAVEWNGGERNDGRLLGNIYTVPVLKRLGSSDEDAALPLSVLDAPRTNGSGAHRQSAAALSPAFVALSASDVHQRLGAKRLTPEQLSNLPVRAPPTQAELSALPDEYDVRSVGGMSCAEAVRVGNQGNCGCCWAFAASSVFSARLCLATRGATNVQVAQQSYLSCYRETSDGGFYMSGGAVTGTQGKLTPADGCNGGNAIFAWLNQQRDGGYEGRVCNPYQGKSFRQLACGQQVCTPAPTKYAHGPARVEHRLAALRSTARRSSSRRGLCAGPSSFRVGRTRAHARAGTRVPGRSTWSRASRRCLPRSAPTVQSSRTFA